MPRKIRFNIEPFNSTPGPHARGKGGGGYNGPTAAEIEAQAQRDFQRQQFLVRQQEEMAIRAEERRMKYEREQAEQLRLEEEARAAAQAELDRKAAAAENAAAQDAQATAADVTYDPNSGLIYRLMRDDAVEIPEEDEAQ